MSLRPAYPVRTARLLLRPLVDADAGGLLAYRSQPDVCRWVPFEPMDAQGIAAALRGPYARTTLDAGGDALVLGVELAATGELVGDVLLCWVSEPHRCGEVGYVFHPAFAGRGYATEAVHELLHLAFDDLGLHRVIARVDARNSSSVGVTRRLGMRLEAHLVENEWFKGAWSDELDFAVLRAEWQARHAGGEGCARGGRQGTTDGDEGGHRPAPS